MGKPVLNKPYKKIGLLGGSFNPAHEGHLYISQKAIELLALDEVWWILSPHNPLKDKRTIWPYEERVESAKKLLENQPLIQLSEIESSINSQYTVDTLTHLKQTHKEHHFIWLMGEDNLYNFHRWHKWEAIAQSMPIAVMARKVEMEANYQKGLLAPSLATARMNESDATKLHQAPTPAWVFLPIEHHPLSSTKIRTSGK